MWIEIMHHKKRRTSIQSIGLSESLIRYLGGVGLHSRFKFIVLGQAEVFKLVESSLKTEGTGNIDMANHRRRLVAARLESLGQKGNFCG